MEQSNKKTTSSDLKGLKKSSVKKSNPSFLSKLFGLTEETVYEFQDDSYELYGSDINKKWRGGIITTKDGKIFPNGKGYFYGEDGKKIEKEIKSFKFDNGASYTGQWKDDKKNGQGKLTYQDGASYEGEWKDSKRNGQGTYTYQNGDSYTGEWKDGNMEGQRKLIYQNGDSYTGEWKDGKKHGQGKFIFKNNISYEGEFKDNIATDFSEIIITDSETKLHTITKEGQSYFYQLKGGGKQEIDMGNEKRLKSVLLQFGNADVNQKDAVEMKDSKELSEFIKSQIASSNEAKPSIYIIEIPRHAFTMLFDKNGVAYCFDNGGLRDDSLKDWLTYISENNVQYVNLPHKLNLKFQLKDKPSIDIPIATDTLQYCCRHKANVVYEKLKELKGELKENENLYDKFDEYLKEVSKVASNEVPKKLIRINSRCNSFQQDEDMSIAMENVVVNKVNILNYKTFNQIILAQVPKAVIRP